MKFILSKIRKLIREFLTIDNTGYPLTDEYYKQKKSGYSYYKLYKEQVVLLLTKER